MSNKTVKHISFGEGIITKEKDGKVFVQFEISEKNSHTLLLKNM